MIVIIFKPFESLEREKKNYMYKYDVLGNLCIYVYITAMHSKREFDRMHNSN